jgi:hypothetical protein
MQGGGGTGLNHFTKSNHMMMMASIPPGSMIPSMNPANGGLNNEESNKSN